MRVFFTLVLVILIAGGIVALENPSWLKVERFQIELAENSNQDLLFQRIRTSLQAQFQVYQGRYVWQVPLKVLYELVAKDKRVKKVSIYREFPSVFRLVVEPHTPVLAYLDRDGRIYPVAADAALLPAVSASEAPDLPILRGESFRDEIGLRELALDLFKSVPDDGPVTKASVSEIIYNAKDGFKVFVSGTGAEVKLGDSDFGPKLSRVQKVLSYLDSQNIKGRVIDARFSKKVVVRLRNTP